MAEKTKTITVEALQAHSYNGKDYAVGDTYDIDEQYAESVAIQGKAIRTDRAKVAKDQAKEAERSQKEQEKAAKDAGKVEAKAAKSPARQTKNQRVANRKA